MTTPSYLKLGNSVTAANNVVLRNNDDGTVSICFGNVGAETEKFKLNADGSLVIGAAGLILPATVAERVLTNSLGADVLLNNTGLYFDGPSVAQGTVGTWFVSGQFVLIDTTGAANLNWKLWDGTSIMASGYARALAASQYATSVPFSGFITNPAGNIRVSVNDSTNATGKIVYNASGNAKDSTITAVRIG